MNNVLSNECWWLISLIIICIYSLLIEVFVIAYEQGVNDLFTNSYISRNNSSKFP